MAIKYKAIVIVKIGHIVEADCDNVEDFKQAVSEKFSGGYGGTLDSDNDTITWNPNHEFVEYDSIKEGSIEQLSSTIIE